MRSVLWYTCAVVLESSTRMTPTRRKKMSDPLQALFGALDRLGPTTWPSGSHLGKVVFHSWKKEA